MKKKSFREKVNFSKAELQRNQVAFGALGISIENPTVLTKEYSDTFERTRDWLDFGWAGNDPKFYENAAMNDIAPKKEDFVEKPFRLISATTVGGGSWKATDFSQVGVLRKSYKKLEGKPLYKDHETDLDNWVGLVTGVKWSASFVDSSGITVPAGIDGMVAIDVKTNPKVARGVMMGSIFSNSVTVEFDWEMSHHFENVNDFYYKVGTMADDGKMIRRIVTDIHNYHESSLVWLGADPFAKAIDTNGNLTHIDVGSVYNFTKAQYRDKMGGAASDSDKFTEEEQSNLENTKKFRIGFGISKNCLSLAYKDNTRNFRNDKNDKMDKKFIAAFVAQFGKELGLTEGAVPTAEDMTGYIKKLNFSTPEQSAATAKKVAFADKVEGLALVAVKVSDEAATTVDTEQFFKDYQFLSVDEVTRLQGEAAKVTNLTNDNVSLKKDADLGKAHLAAKREEAIRLYKVATGESSDESVIEMFKKAEDSAITGLLKQYGKGATAKFGGKCSDCGSSKFEFGSAFVDKTDGEGDTKPAFTTSFHEMYEDVKDDAHNFGE